MKKEQIEQKFGFDVLEEFNIDSDIVQSIEHNYGGSYNITLKDPIPLVKFDLEAAERGATVYHYDGTTKEIAKRLQYINGKPEFKGEAIIFVIGGLGNTFTIDGKNSKGETVLFMRKGYKVELSLHNKILVSNDLDKWYNANFIFKAPSGHVFCAVADNTNYDLMDFSNYSNSKTYIQDQEAFKIHPFKYYKNIYY